MEAPGVAWSPLPTRPHGTWAGETRLAVTVVVVLDTLRGDCADGRPVVGGGMGPRPAPDLARLSQREYGLRVGVFRVLDRLDAHGIRPTVAIDLATAQRRRFLVELVGERGDDVIAAGASAGEALTGARPLTDEQRLIDGTLDGLSDLFGRRPRGWLGPGSAESLHTPALLVRSGVEYVCDWVNDEQPYAMATDEGALVVFPVALELDTGHAIGERRVPAGVWAEQIRRAGNRLAREATNGASRVLVVVLRPWLIGQPFRSGALDAALDALGALPAWRAPAGEVVAAWGIDHEK